MERIIENGEIRYTAGSMLDGTGLIRHGFMSRKGGISTGVWESMNLSFERGDTKEHVLANFSLAAECFGSDPAHIVTAMQTHTANIRRVTAADAGKGVVRERDYADIDGLVTDERGLLLSTTHADCTPIFLLDPVHKAIGMVHSGWRGTVQRITAEAIRVMEESYGSDPTDMLAYIGPCICGSCYEVGAEVAVQFMDIFCGGEYALIRKPDGKYLLDLKAANRRILIEEGLIPDHIDISELCTFERDDLFFSHRRMGPVRGQMAAFMMLV